MNPPRHAEGEDRPPPYQSTAAGATPGAVRSPAGSAPRRRIAPRLGRAFWLGFVLPLGLLGMAVDALTFWIHLPGSALRGASVALLLLWPALLAVAAWGGWRAWRAAAPHPGQARLWSLGARGFIAAAGVLTLAGAALGFVPQLPSLLSLAGGVDPLGAVRVQVSDDGRRVRLQGPLGQDDGARVLAALARAPRAYLLELDSAGGRFHEAAVIAAALPARGLQTRVVGACDDACVLVFMAAPQRQLAPDGRLGLRRISSGAINPLARPLARHWLATVYREAGLPPSFIDRTLGTSPASRWTPEVDELIAGAVIGTPGRPYDVALPPREGARPAEYIEALRSNPVWRDLDRQRPGLIEAAVAPMAAAHGAGADADAVQVAAQRMLEPLRPELLRTAGDALREQFVDLLADELAAARALGPQACRAVLAGDTAARRALPAPLVMRGAEWLASAAAELPTAAPPRRLSSIEMEVVRRSLGERASEVASLVRRASAAPDCERTIELLAELRRLPPPERRLLIRLI